MKLWSLSLINIAFGGVAGVLVAGAREVGFFGSSAPVLPGPFPLNRVFEPFIFAILVIGVLGTALATVRQILAFRTASQRVADRISATEGSLSSSEWRKIVEPLCADEHLEIPPPRSVNVAGDMTSALFSRETRLQLMRVRWRNLSVMQVWTSLTILSLAAVALYLVWPRSLSNTIAIFAFGLLGGGAALLLLLLILSNLLIRNRIDRFIATAGRLAVRDNHDLQFSLRAYGDLSSVSVQGPHANELDDLWDQSAPERSMIETEEFAYRPTSATGCADQQVAESSLESNLIPAKTEQAEQNDIFAIKILRAIDDLHVQQAQMREALQALDLFASEANGRHQEILRHIDIIASSSQFPQLGEKSLVHTKELERILKEKC